MKNIGKDPLAELAIEAKDTLYQTLNVLSGADNCHRVLKRSLRGLLFSIDDEEACTDVYAIIQMLSEVFGAIETQLTNIEHCVSHWQELAEGEVTPPKTESDTQQETLH